MESLTNSNCFLVDLLNATEVSKILKVSRQEVYKLVQLGEITSVRIGKSVRIRPEDLEKFIESAIVYKKM